MIRGGYVLQARKVDDSEIAFKPPHFREIFNWLYRQANHSDNGKFKRGQCFRSINDIQEGLKWFVGYRKCTYTKDQCEKALKWLRKAKMIETTKATRGMFITICNYEFYQDPKNYESNNESHKKATRKPQGSHTKNKNDNNENNEKKYLVDFENLWSRYPNRVGKKEALKHFSATIKNSNDITDINYALNNYINHLQSNSWKRSQNGSTWFNNWRDWVSWVEPNQQSDSGYYTQEEVMELNAKNGITGTFGYKLVKIDGKIRYVNGEPSEFWYVKNEVKK